MHHATTSIDNQSGSEPQICLLHAFAVNFHPISFLQPVFTWHDFLSMMLAPFKKHSRLETDTREASSDDLSWLVYGQLAFATCFWLPWQVTWQVIELRACLIGHRLRQFAHVFAPCAVGHKSETCCYDCAVQFSSYQYDNFDCAVRLELILLVALDCSHRLGINLQARRAGQGYLCMTLACRKAI